MTLINVQIAVGNPLPPPDTGSGFTVPAAGRFVQIRHDWETTHWDERPRCYSVYGESMPASNPNGQLPDTVYMPGCKAVGDFLHLTEARQNLWFDLMSRATDDTWGFPELAIAWLNVTQDGKAMTDDHSWSHNESRNTDPSKMFREYITGKNLTTNDRDMAIKSLHMGGNIAKVIGEDGAGNWLIETLNFSPGVIPPSVDDVWEKPWLFGWLTQSTKDAKAIDWPQLGPHGVPFPVIGLNGVNKLPKAWTKPIENGAEYSPYS
jgi:hypothetical protein